MSTSHTGIEWTDRTWNPVTGCTKVSPGCDHCYAEGIANRFAGTKAFPNGFDITLHDSRLTRPLSWRKPSRIFVNSMSDLFHADVPDQFIAKVFAVMALAPQHTFQILTKRHARMRSVLLDRCIHGGRHQDGIDFRSEMAWAVSKANPDRPAGLPDDAEHRVYFETPWPLPNVWLGVSVEDQRWANIRIPALLETPAAVRFLSCEPLLGPIDLLGPIVPGRGRPTLTYWLDGRPGWGPEQVGPTGLTFQEPAKGPRIDWVIVGGESGHGARAMHPGWARTIRDQCQQSGVPFLFKQHGEWGPAPFIVRVCDPEVGWKGTEAELVEAKRASEAAGATHVHSGNWHMENGERVYSLHGIGHKPWSLERVGLPDGHEPMRRWGKKAAGRVIDGRTWDEYPGGAR
jgi:protein gp37